jgi:uncharacterized protein (DUF2147 family)
MTVASRLWSIATALALVIALPAFAIDTSTIAPTIAGVWWTPDRDGKIEIAVNGSGGATGRLIALAPSDADNVDDNNPDPNLRAQPVLGLVILRSFWPGKSGMWSGGRIYDPDSGTTYAGTLELGADGRLSMRSAVLFGLVSRAEVLTRVAGPLPATQQPDEPDLVYFSR